MNSENNSHMDLDLNENKSSKLAAFGNAFVANGFTMYPVLILLLVIGAIVAPRF